MGGRLDSTNIITPEVSVITNISFDHTSLLGETLQKIATEKAGIIKKNIPAVISQYQQEVAGVFLQKAEAEQAPIWFASDEFSADNGLRESDGRQVFNFRQFGKTRVPAA